MFCRLAETPRCALSSVQYKPKHDTLASSYSGRHGLLRRRLRLRLRVLLPGVVDRVVRPKLAAAAAGAAVAAQEEEPQGS